eukprot:gene10329-11401_t
MAATESLRCPLCIRTDHGTENIAVARWMLDHHSENLNSVLTALSPITYCIQKDHFNMQCSKHQETGGNIGMGKKSRNGKNGDYSFLVLEKQLGFLLRQDDC